MDKRLRILHLPDVVGGHATALANAETKLGAHSQSLAYLVSPFGYQADATLRFTDATAIVRWGERLLTFLRHRTAHDVFHFNFGSSLFTTAGSTLTLVDLPLYPKRAVKVMTFQGSDLRRIYPSVLKASLEAELTAGTVGVDAQFNALTSDDTIKRTEERQRKALAHCDVIFALNPDLIGHLPKGRARFLPYATQWPVLDETPANPKAERTGQRLKVLHLSTNRLLKGTAMIEAALAPLVAEGLIEFEAAVRIPRDQALAKIAAADVLIDQMVLGWYGAQAVEAMYLKTPVVCAIDPAQKALTAAGLAEELPIIASQHEELEQVIRAHAEDPRQLPVIAEQGYTFAQKWHSPEAVARQTLDIYREAFAFVQDGRQSLHSN